LFDKELRKKVERLKDKSGRNYEGGLLEKAASTLSISLCIYDNYPEIDIDLILSAIILNCLCKGLSKDECYSAIKEYDELVPFLFKKKRKKPTVELTIFNEITKLDNKVYMGLRRRSSRKSIKGEVKG